MAAHLRDCHPNWELTATAETRQALELKVAITHSEECRLGVPERAMVTQPESQAQEPSPSDKRPAMSPVVMFGSNRGFFQGVGRRIGTGIHS